ncbi:primosomal protein N' [Aeromonas diversa]|uniref:primosomal protein N' n=1 Tax=Aeromonas diversa TaxID=502790 RepID=UPI00039F7FB8|nr:primosomal protein N' [Aeromonas diversa]
MNSSNKLDLVRVAVPVPLRRPFDYLCPRPLPTPGCRVEIPFGHQTLVALVVDHPTESALPREKLKPVKQVLDATPVLGPDILALMQWSASYYQYPLGEVLAVALPVLVRKGEPAAYRELEFWFATEAGQACDINELKRAPKQQQALALLRQGPQTPSALRQEEVQSAAVTALEKKGLVERRSLEPSHPTDWAERLSCDGALHLSTEQALAVSAVTSQRDRFNAFLLEGITGSGKTEVYLSILEPLLREGKQALVMVPEIGLTPQTINRFKRRFNVPVVAMHSGMNDRERLDAWLACRDGGAAILIGTRSTVFTPFKRLGIIIIDEEHDASFKQQEGFRYHARDLAVMRAHRAGIPILLGSATPSLESLHNARGGKYHHLRLTRRAGNATKARQVILDIKNVRLQAGLSPQLERLMAEHLAAGNQVMLFLNRRGYAPALICHQCGWSAACERCDAWYTWHQAGRRLHCHHCDSVRPLPHSCPECGSHELIGSGVGTEQLEQLLTTLFPHYPVVRIDRDSTARKGELESHLEGIRSGHYKILIGTQMLAKGHHFPDVTLVGLIDVDGALFSADFRAAERLAQLYTQVAGRAGRASKPGLVVLQSHHPEHALLQDLTQNGYDHFADTALKERRLLSLPPFSHQALFKAEATGQSEVHGFLTRLAETLRLARLPGLQVIGPLSATMERKAGKYRMHLMVQAPVRAALAQLLEWVITELEAWPETKRVRWVVDVDPIELG